jgi:predicted PurR-regulated permease PerM
MLGCWVAGLRAPVLLGAVTVILALTPLGAPLVYVSASAWLALGAGRVLAGVLFLLWGLLIVSMADNVIRTWFLAGAVRVPFLLGLFGVLGGILAFGSIGLFIGPVAIALLLTLWRQWTAEDGAAA